MLVYSKPEIINCMGLRIKSYYIDNSEKQLIIIFTFVRNCNTNRFLSLYVLSFFNHTIRDLFDKQLKVRQRDHCILSPAHW